MFGWNPLSAVAITALLIALAAGRGETSEAVDLRLQAYLQRCEPNYSREHHLLGTRFSSPGYHSTVASGTWVHTTRWSLNYAAALLQRSGPGDAERAGAIVRQVLALQDTDPQSRTYGIWPWLLEEPLQNMSPPDWNWADFCGALLAQLLIDQSAKLPQDLQQAMRTSLGHAARAIRKRKVGPDYTNIAIMGGGVCAAAGELLADAELLQYGRQRLESVVKHTADNGSFAEYNSPTYTLVALEECERTLQLVRDPATRAAAESLRRTAWQIIAESFHPGTQQWAGPHSRAYGDHLSAETAAYLAESTGATIEAHPSKRKSSRALNYEPVRHLPCPKDWIGRFRALPNDPYELRRTFIRRRSPAESTTGTTWFTAQACLGSISHSSLWTQRRPLIGYWKTADDPAVVFKVRFLHDGRDFASMGMRTQQRGSRTLSVFYLLKGQGDWHPGLDRPRDGIFQAADFRLRFELSGKGVQASHSAALVYVLAAGNHRVVIHALPGRFAGQQIAWELGRQGQSVFLDAVCYHGPKKAFHFHEPLEVVLAAGTELLRSEEPAAAQPPQLSVPQPGTSQAAWQLPGGDTLEVRAQRE